LLEETDSSGKLKTDTIYLNDLPVADATPNGLYFLHADRLGTPVSATTSRGASAWQGNYQPFGINTGGVGLLTQNIRFPGQYDDTESGFYQNGFRDYNPAWGRYLESDPIGLSGGINTFGYANGNPVTRFDPMGTQVYSEEERDDASPSIRMVMNQVNDRSEFYQQLSDYFSEIERGIRDQAELNELLEEVNRLTETGDYLLDTSELPDGPVINWKQYVNGMIQNRPRPGPVCTFSNPDGGPELKPLPRYTVQFFYNPNVPGVDIRVIRN
jgi:RHS repeat-associated protein